MRVPRSPAWRLALVIAAMSTIAIPATAALGGASGPGGYPSALTGVSRGPITALVRATGTLRYLAQPDGSPYTVVDRATGTLTALPAVGQVAQQGQVLYRVADTPVVLLDGTTPAYRALSQGDSGPDVRELNADLVALRYATRSQLDPSSSYFSTSTAVALEKLQAKLGLNRTGTLPLGEAVFLPAPIRITAVNAALGTGYSPDPSGAGAAAPRPEFVDLVLSSPPSGRVPDKCKPHKRVKCKHHRRRHHHRPKRKRPQRGKGPGGKAPGKAGRPGAGPGSHNAPSGTPGAGSGSPGSPGHGGSPGGRGGSPGGGSAPPAPARPILQATSTRRDVIVQLDARAARAVKAGQRALITLPNGRTTTGTVTDIGTTADASGDVSVHVRLDHPSLAGDLDEVSVQVRITTASVTSTLRVPVTALIAQGDGRFAVRVIGAHGGTRLVTVDVGLFDDATGLVQVTGPLTPREQLLEP